MKKAHVDIQRVYQIVLERFGEPIGKAKDAGEGVADERDGHPRKGVSLKNRGFGAGLDEALSAPMCQSCGAMMGMDESTCDECGYMAPGMDERQEPFKRKPGKEEHPGSVDEGEGSNRVQVQVQGDWNGTTGSWRPLKTFNSKAEAEEYITKTLGAEEADTEAHSWNRWTIPSSEPEPTPGTEPPPINKWAPKFRLAHDAVDAGAFVKESVDEGMSDYHDETGNLVGKDLYIGRSSGKATVRNSTFRPAKPQDKRNMGASVDWNGMEEADDELTQMKLGISDRSWGLPGDAATWVDDKDVHYEPMRATLDEPKSGTRVRPSAKPPQIKRKTGTHGMDEIDLGKRLPPGTTSPFAQEKKASNPLAKRLPLSAKHDEPNDATDAPKTDEVAPPGREKQVRSLKNEPSIENPYASSTSYNKRKNGPTK